VAAAVGHAGELLDVDVDQFAATAGLDASDHPAGRTVHPAQLVHAVADQHPMHRRGGHPDDPRQPSWAETAGLAQRDDAPLDRAGV
jgi:hypothetical protein